MTEFPFQVGDLIVGWPTGVPLQITAIGKKRFLFVRATDSWNKECVGTIKTYGKEWRKFDPGRFPDSQYAYVLESKDYCLQNKSNGGTVVPRNEE